MTTFKGDSSTLSLVVEDNGWGQPPTSYAGGKYMQTNDGTFNAERSALESEARTPNAELAGQRLGNTNVTGSFPVEIDPENYNELLESAFYGRFTESGTFVDLVTASIFSATKYQITVDVATGDQTTLGAKIGDAYLLTSIVLSEFQKYQGVAILLSKTSTDMTFFVPSQTEATVASQDTNLTITPVATLRPDKDRQSFNAEEILHGEDGVTEARFMTVGAVVSGVEFDIPADNTIKATFSFIGSGKNASSEYEDFDPTLTNNTTAHTSIVSHTKYNPLVLQDGAIISDTTDVRCQWLSGSVSIENGTEAFFTGCSYDAKGANSGKFRINLSYEALFESEAAYIAFKAENTSKVMLKLKVRDTDKCLVIYLPAFKPTSYTVNNSTGLVTASISGGAEVDPIAINSAIIASYYA